MWYNSLSDLEDGMPRRIKPKNQKKDWRWYASFAMNAAVALSMVLGTVLLFSGGPPAPAVPTIVPPTESAGSTPPAAAPTSTPASQPGQPTPTPQANAGARSVAQNLPGVVASGHASEYAASYASEYATQAILF